VSYILTQLLNIAMTYFIAKLDCQIYSMRSIETGFMPYGQDSPVRLNVVELCINYSSDFEMCTWTPVSGAPQYYY
jgi:hypothetical protein